MATCMKIISISYEEARLDYFKKQKEKARRKYAHHLKRLKRTDSPLSENSIAVNESTEVFCYYRDVVEMLEKALAERKVK